MDAKKWVDISLAGISIIIFFVFQQAFDFLWDSLRLPAFEEWVVTLPTVVALVLGIILYLVLRMNSKVTGFSTEVVLELSKMTWPARKETIVSGAVVIVMVGIAAIILFLYDTVWGTVSQRLLAL